MNILNDISAVYLEQVSAASRAKNAVANDRLDAEQEKTNASMDKLRKQNKRFDRASASDAARKVERDVKKSSAYGPQRPKPGTVTGRRIEDPKPTGSKPTGYRTESAVPGKPAERLGAVTAIPKSEQEAARERLLAKAKAKRDSMKEERNDEPGEGTRQKYGDMRGLDRSGAPTSFGGKWQSDERKKSGAAALAKLKKEETEIDEAVYGGTPAKKEEPKDDRYTVTAADKKGNTLAYQNYKKGDKRYKAAPHLGEENEIDEGMTMKDFKANRRKLKRREASADAKKRGHVGKEWYNSGRTYSPDEAKSGRAKMDDEERSTRKRSAIDPDAEDSDYSADKTKNPKKLRKQKAMGEGYLKEKALSRAQQRFMGMVYAAKKGETPASPEVAKAASGMSKKAAKDFAKTKHKGLPEKKEVKESATEVAMSPQELALQKRKTALDVMIAKKRQQSLRKSK